jgi:hypothetical protein
MGGCDGRVWCAGVVCGCGVRVWCAGVVCGCGVRVQWDRLAQRPLRWRLGQCPAKPRIWMKPVQSRPLCSRDVLRWGFRFSSISEGSGYVLRCVCLAEQHSA